MKIPPHSPFRGEVGTLQVSGGRVNGLIGGDVLAAVSVYNNKSQYCSRLDRWFGKLISPYYGLLVAFWGIYGTRADA